MTQKSDTCDKRVRELRHKSVSEAVPSNKDSNKIGAACCTAESSPRSSTMKLEHITQDIIIINILEGTLNTTKPTF